MEWHETIKISEGDRLRKVNVAGKNICIVEEGGKVYAVSGKCPHAGADLSQGWCVENKLFCPVHRYSYNLGTGRGSEGQNDYIEIFPVEVRNNVIYIGITSFWDKLKKIF